MIFQPTALEGAYIIELVQRIDDRGFFSRSFCADEFRKHGLTPTVSQCNLSFSHRRGTLRGFHYQVAPAMEAKLVRCTRGAIFDVIVDLRKNSPTYLKHVCVELTDENRRAFFVPENFAHAYLALTDGAEVFYQVSHPYSPGAERGICFDDPVLEAIEWPISIEVVSDKDRRWPTFAGTATRPPTAT